ncbi:hypothetical protein [Acidovorax sp. sic0104]|uniref:hypothetical protein n=1 Tax=Acidovorax sp. sic0104 TaxID=2854784 RepID=UPI001C467CEC|nr:hypothetical protein [Acidovorax sp. sic0104]
MTAYVIPPVNAEAIGTGNDRFGIKPSMLLYSSVPEAPPAAYDPGAAYALGAEVLLQPLVMRSRVGTTTG